MLLLLLNHYKQLNQPNWLNLHAIREGMCEGMAHSKIMHDDHSLFLD